MTHLHIAVPTKTRFYASRIHVLKSTLLIEISGPFVADKASVPCSLAGDNAEQGSCVSREKFSVLLQVVNGFEILVDKK